MARPTGVGRAISTYEIPIEGRDEWLAAAEGIAHARLEQEFGVQLSEDRCMKCSVFGLWC
jgi:hypothetical protein